MSFYRWGNRSSEQASGDFTSYFDATAELLSRAEELTASKSKPAVTVQNRDETTLSRMLTINAVVRTDSQHAQQQQQDLPAASYKKIGAGACGHVFSMPNQPYVVKLLRTNIHSLENDFLMHLKILKYLDLFPVAHLTVPRCQRLYIPGTDPYRRFISEHPELVEAAKSEVNFPATILLSDRILPLPLPIRKLLINKFCPEPLQERVLANPGDVDCLVRPYLGKLQATQRGRVSRLFSLKNFKMSLDQIVELDVDYEEIARAMGQSLSVMHWAAETDARDVEFVLGSVPELKTPRYDDVCHVEDLKTVEVPPWTPSNSVDYSYRRTALFLLDFNLVQNITVDDSGVTAAVNAFKTNDPYYPRPNGGSWHAALAWNNFCQGYLRTAYDISLYKPDPAVRHLARSFLCQLEQEYPIGTAE